MNADIKKILNAIMMDYIRRSAGISRISRTTRNTIKANDILFDKL